MRTPEKPLTYGSDYDYTPHPLYAGCTETDPAKIEHLVINDGDDQNPVKMPIRFQCVKPTGSDGQPRDQTNDAADHMRYAASLKLPELQKRITPRYGRAIIVGGAPSIKEHIEDIRRLAANSENAVFAINWSHTWLIDNGIIPKACVFFEIDSEPETVLKRANPDVTYYICSHCHNLTFDMLKDYKRVLWHSPPNSEAERLVGEELFVGSHLVGGGIGTFTRTLTVALYLGYRHFDLFGCDSSFPDDGKTHADGYETPMDPEKDGFFVYAKNPFKNEIRRFKTLGYLALQQQEFMEYCRQNHAFFSLKVHGDSLLQYSHQILYPEQYSDG